METFERKLLEEFGYEEFEAKIINEDILKMDEDSKKIMTEYITTKKIPDYSCGEYSVKILFEQCGMNVIASIIAISKLKLDYEKYSCMYKRGFK